MRSPAPKSVATPELHIGYFEHGNPTGTPVLLLHGFPDSPVAWTDVIDYLDTANLRLIIPYLRGFGPTTVLQPDLVGGQEAALAHDILALADTLGLSQFHLAGHDWGARAAYAAAVLAPERIQTLLALASPYFSYGGKDLPPEQVNAYWYQWFFQLEPAEKMLTGNAEAFCHQLWRAWSPDWAFSKGDFAEAALAWNNPQFVATVLHYYRTRHGGALSLRAYAALQTRLDTKPLPKISVRTVFVQGGADHCTLPASSEDQASAFTGPYERILLKGAGHFPHREDPKAIAKLLTRLLET